MNSRSQLNWAQLALDAYLLSFEASHVVWLRWQRLMFGGSLATRESKRMVAEKLTAGMTLVPVLAASGALESAESIASGALAHYGKIVRANRRRLAR